jgi:4-hydroxy-4-methyl-2-oxoglutarate aldolase
VVDGAVRDVDGLDELGLATFARGTHPATASNEGPGALNVTVQCGGVVVEPGDIVRGDRNGVVVVPRAHAEQVLNLSQAVAAREAVWVEELAAGTSLTTAFGIDARIATVRPR